MPSHFPDPDDYHLKRFYDDKFTEAMLKIRAERETAFHAFCLSIEEKLTHIGNAIRDNRDDINSLTEKFASFVADTNTPADARLPLSFSTSSRLMGFDEMNVEKILTHHCESNFCNCVHADRDERYSLRPVRNLRAKSPNVKICDPTIEGVAGFLGCGADTIAQVQPQPPNQLGKQRVMIYFTNGEAAAAAQQTLKSSSNSSLAVLDHKRTALQNQVVNLAIQLQEAARQDSRFAEATFFVQGDSIMVKVAPAGVSSRCSACSCSQRIPLHQALPGWSAPPTWPTVHWLVMRQCEQAPCSAAAAAAAAAGPSRA